MPINKSYTTEDVAVFVQNNLDAKIVTKQSNFTQGYLCGYSNDCCIIGFHDVYSGWTVRSVGDTILSSYESYLYRAYSGEAMLKTET